MASESKVQNETWYVKQKLVGMPTTDNFEKKSSPVVGEADLKEGEVLLKSLFVSVDPYLRGLLRTAEVGSTVTAGCCSEIIASKAEKFPKGAFVHAYTSWARYNVVDTTAPGATIRLVDPKVAPLSTSNGVLGMPGMTAYYGLLKAAELRPGDKVLVSGAAGAVGSLVGQIAKIKGCYVVGTAGSDDKIQWLKELGFDEALNYKSFKGLDGAREALKKVFPDGIDVYFDNTGGDVTDAVFDLINYEARIAICGQIAHYNEYEQVPQHPRFLHKLIYKQATVRGFIVRHYMKDLSNFLIDFPTWLKEGKLKYRETIFDGFDRIPEAFIGLFTGANIGKLQVKVADPPSE